MEFSDVGKHCAVQDCKERDFLPFSCDFCNKCFCLNHRSETSHHCQTKRPDNEAIFCPICKHQILVCHGENAQRNLAIHANSKCQKYVVETIERLPCALGGCKSESVVLIRCFSCKKEFCLPHRAPDAHKCAGEPESTTCTIAWEKVRLFCTTNLSGCQMFWRNLYDERKWIFLIAVSFYGRGEQYDSDLPTAVDEGQRESRLEQVCHQDWTQPFSPKCFPNLLADESPLALPTTPVSQRRNQIFSPE